MVADDPKRLIMTIRKGKTGYRSSNTMPAAVSVYERICERSSERHPDEYLFLPEYTNRTTASQIMRRQFNALLKRAGQIERPVFTTSYCDLHAYHNLILRICRKNSSSILLKSNYRTLRP
jgi:hypothetical protein